MLHSSSSVALERDQGDWDRWKCNKPSFSTGSQERGRSTHLSWRQTILRLTFGPQVPIEGAVLCKPTAAFVTFEWLLARVVTDVAHQRTLFPKALVAELADERLFIQVRSEMNLLCILWERRSGESAWIPEQIVFQNWFFKTNILPPKPLQSKNAIQF